MNGIRDMTCNFIGQALGLALHTGGGTSCMNTNTTTAVVSSLDLSLLNQLYAKP